MLPGIVDQGQQCGLQQLDDDQRTLDFDDGHTDADETS